jgi:phosphoserine aminotransferase
LFLQGGGASQFHMVPMNLLNENETASYVDSGLWAHLAMEEAKNFGNVRVLSSSRESNYNHIPKMETSDWQQTGKYVHLTTNNTIYGTQLNPASYLPSAVRPSIVADMSSDIFSRQLDFNQYDLIYAGAQKNAGAAGTTIVVLNKNILGKVDRKIPKMLDYRIHIEKESMTNTPSVFAVYVSYLTLKWIKKEGLRTIEERNNRKAAKLYDAIDTSQLFEGTVAKEDRSMMNVCFAIKDKSLEEKFLEAATQQNIVGIKGYRTVGGFRASIYNAMPESGVDTLVEVMKEFERRS